MGAWVTWTEDLNVNIDRIDEQHQELFNQFNILGDAVWDGKGKDAVHDLLTFLADYTVKHFGEEEFMMGSDYPDFAKHKLEHKKLVAEVSEFIALFAAGSVDSPVVISVVNKLGDWTRQHIRVMDRGLGNYIREKGLTFR